jgi:predicted dehydrogenase
MADKLKMGFIGLGFVGPQHADGVALNWDIATAYAVADDDPAKQEMAKNMGLKTYDDAEQMIADPDIDTVHIAGPDRFHADWSIQAMDAGKKIVVCEKPMTLTLDDSVRVLERAQKYEAEGGVFMTNINYMGHALPRAAREMRLNGDLGDIAIVQAFYEQDWLMDPNVWSWRLDGKMCASKDILPHLVSATYFMGGLYPTRLIADSATIVKQRKKPVGRTDAFSGEKADIETEPVDVESDLYSSVLCDFQNGGKGNFLVTQYLAGRQNWWEITLGGSKRRITWNQANPNEMEIGQILTSDESGKITPQSVSNLQLLNNPVYLQALGLKDAAQYSPYPGQHPAGHIDAFARNFKAAYQVAAGNIKREDAVIPGVMIGHICVCVADAVERSIDAGGQYVDVDYRGVDLSELKL